MCESLSEFFSELENLAEYISKNTQDPTLATQVAGLVIHALKPCGPTIFFPIVTNVICQLGTYVPRSKVGTLKTYQTSKRVGSDFQHPINVGS